jgi:hypothetical protein
MRFETTRSERVFGERGTRSNGYEAAESGDHSRAQGATV